MTAGVVTFPNYAGSGFTPIDAGGAVIAQSAPYSYMGSMTTSAQTNSTSVTLSYAFTVLTFTQTSTGNTVNLPASPVDRQVCGFSITNNVTNLTVSSAANTVLNGASTNTSSAGSTYWWVFNNSNTSWYRCNGDPLGT